MAKLILKNGRNYGDASHYQDLLSKPTINTHLVEGEGATSGSLDIFKYISIDDYKELLVKNPYAVYAVCDEDNFIRNYFIHGSETYCFTDYFQVTELPEIGDPTVLYYLIDNTDTYGKGTWFWTETEPGTYGYVSAGSPEADSKTILIVPETGELNTQIGGYVINDADLVEKSLITNKTPKKCYLSDDGKKTVLEFAYDYFFHYTPATKYKMALNFSGDVVRTELFPTDTMGTDEIVFTDDKLILYLKAGVYTSLEPSDYHLTLSWFEPQNISYINKLFLDIDEETIRWVEGEMHTDIVQNAYTSINELNDYLYNVYYNNMDYPGADKFFATHPNLSVLGGCTTIHSGDLTGRVYDNFYDESVEFVIETSNRVGRYATIGIASSIEGLTKDVVGNGEYSEMYEILPFMISEGINENGLVVTSHLIKADKEIGSFIRPEADKQITLNSNAIPRYLLDNCKSAGEAVMQLRDHVLTKVNQGLLQSGYVPAYIICDRTACYCIQLIEESYTVSTESYLTNFYLWGTIPNDDGAPYYTPETGDATINGVTLHGQGLERFNTVAEVYDTLNNRAAMFDILRENDYKKVYTEDTRLSDWCWLEDVKVNTSVTDILANADVQRLKSAYTARSRDPEDPNYGTWHSKHMGVYNSLLKSLIITIQDDDSTQYKFSLSEDSVELAKMVLGEISKTERDTSQNSILQILADCIWSEHRPTQINYNNETIVFGSPDIKEDYWGNKYFILSNDLNGSFYILIRVYIDDNHNVLGARRYEQYFGKYEELDPGLGSFLPVHSMVGFSSSSFVTFSGLSAYKIGTLDGWHGDGDLQYSTDKESWTSWDGVTPVPAVQQTNGKYELYLRCDGGTTLGGTNFTMIPGNENINLVFKGVLSTLIDYNSTPNDITYGEGAFKNAFKNMDLFDASLVSLPKHASNFMYESMFENCTNLTYISETLPIYIGDYSFKNTFKNTGITETPIFADIESMGIGAFEGCFMNCENLVSVNKMPYEALTQGCYKNMFAHCTALSKVDYLALPSRTLADNCYESMFEGCTSLNAPVRLYATNLKPECYKCMFKDCVNIEFGTNGEIVRVPFEGTGIIATDCCLDMFAGAEGSVPETTGTPLINKEYYCIVKDFYFESFNPFTVEGINLYFGRKVEYSYDNISWSTWTGYLIAPPKIAGRHTVYFRGEVGPHSGEDINTFGSFKVLSPTADVDVFGNPTVLVGGNVGLRRATFRGLLSGSTGLRSAKNLILPQKGGRDNLFASMFEGCTHLVETPVLYFTETEEWGSAFLRMFFGCTSLVEQPEVHVGTIAASMFRSMFENCTNLITAKKPICENNEIDGYSTHYAFQKTYAGCVSLIEAPSLDYTVANDVIAQGCFWETFAGCTALTTIPGFVSPCSKVMPHGFESMFENSGISNISAITQLSGATQLCEFAYYRMFYGCKSLITPPTFPDNITEMETSVFESMFEASGLKTPPVISSTQGGVRACYRICADCVSLEIPENYELPTGAKESQFYEAFSGCKEITRPPKFTNVISAAEANCLEKMFANCISLKKTPDLTHITEVGYRSMAYMFDNCINLKSVPTALSALTLSESSYAGMFRKTAISKPPQILATNGSNYSCAQMFFNCANLQYPPDLHLLDYSKNNICGEMFTNCVSIKWTEIGTPYRLPATGSATSLDNSGCTSMFANNTFLPNTQMPVDGRPVIEETYYLDLPPDELMWISSINENEPLAQKYKFAPTVRWCSNLDEGVWTWGGICNDPEATKIYFYGYCNDNPIIDGDVTNKPEGNYGYVNTVSWSSIQHKVGGKFEAMNMRNTGNYSYLFDGFSSLVQIDPDIEWGDSGLFAYTFANTGIASITKLPPMVKPYAFKGMFQGCSNLTNVANNIFADMVTTEGAFVSMFADSGIRIIPTLPDTLTTNCFSGMFMNTSLISLTHIELPVLELANYCYYRMFYNTEFNEEVIVELPASTMKKGCYEQMFMGSNIINVPDITIDGYAERCYAAMFKNCRGIIRPKTITLANLSVNVGNIDFLTEMYDGCSFIWAPENVGTPYNIFSGDVAYTGVGAMFPNNDMYISTLGTCSMREDGLIQNPNKTYWLYEAPGYITFTAPAPFSVYLPVLSKYSYDCQDWITSEYSEYSVDSIMVGTEYKLYAKIMGVAKNAPHGVIVVGGNNQVSVSGGLNGFYSCVNAFKHCDEGFGESGLYSAKDLIFEPEILQYRSLYGMFEGCTHLVYPPENIGVTTTSNATINYLPEHFAHMFEKCYSLVTPVKRIATPTTAAPGMYAYMYAWSGISEPPEEGVKVGLDFAPNCCDSMFMRCTALAHPSKIVSTGSNPHAYAYTFSHMYAYCDILSSDGMTDTYELPEIYVPTSSTNLEDSGQYAYYEMFAGCHNLDKNLYTIFTDNIAHHACESMYEGCEKLVDASTALKPKTSTATVYNIGSIPDTVISSSFKKMFANCKALTTGTDALACDLIEYAWAEAYLGCYSLLETPKMGAIRGGRYIYCQTFYDCWELVSCANMPFDTLGSIANNSPYGFTSTFYGCKKLTEVPAINIDNSSGDKIEIYAFDSMFKGCISLEEITFTKLEGNTCDYSFQNMFFGCSSLKDVKGTPVWKVNPSTSSAFRSMFEDCISLCMLNPFKVTQLTAGGVEWRGVGDSAFYSMFQGCKSMYIPVVFEFMRNPEGITYEVNPYAFGYTFAHTDICIAPDGVSYTLPANTDIVGIQYSGYTFEGCANFDSSGIVTEAGSVMLGKEIFYDPARPDFGNYITFEGRVPYHIYVPRGMWYRTGDNEWHRSILGGSATGVEAEYSSELSAYTIRLTGPSAAGVDDSFVLTNNYFPPGATEPQDAKAKVYGKLESVLRWEKLHEGEEARETYFDYNLFTHSDIVDASDLIMPEEIIKEEDGVTYVRNWSFAECTRLAYAPKELPAEHLYPHCYSNMFYETAIVGAPVFGKVDSAEPYPPITELAPYCFSAMYYGCKSLKHPPVLPKVDILYDSCYRSMFANCISLEYSPRIFGRVVVEPYACLEMFRNCKKIRNDYFSLPAATVIGNYGYQSMFSGCTELNYIPDLSHITYVGVDSMKEMFADVKGIKWHLDQTGSESVTICSSTATVTPTSFSYMFVRSGGDGTTPPAITPTPGSTYTYDPIV